MEGVKLLGGISAGVLEDDFLNVTSQDAVMELVTMVQCIHPLGPSIHLSHSHNHADQTKRVQSVEKQSADSEINFRIFLFFECPSEPCSAIWCLLRRVFLPSTP